MRIVITRLSALGDIVHTWPLAVALRASGIVTSIAWVVEGRLAPALEGHPAVDRIIPVATRRWRRAPAASDTRTEVRRACAALRAERPDVAIDPQGLIKSAVIGLASGAPRRVGFARRVRREWLAGAFYTRTVAPPPSAVHVVDLNLALATALDVEPRYGDLPDGRFLLRGAAGPEPPSGCLALLPATGGHGKSWPAQSFGALAGRWAERGLPTRVLWGPGERERAETVVASSAGAAQLAPPTGIVELAGYMAGCRAVVGGDTGPVHLAASLGVPTVAIHLATDARRNGPRGARATAVGAAGTPARGSARTRETAEVTVGEVVDALAALLDGAGPGR